MDDAAPEVLKLGSPRTSRDGAFVDHFDHTMRWPIFISAVLPLIVTPEAGTVPGVVVGVATWIVFVVDYVVHQRRLEHYLRTNRGRFDLVVVILTAPWFLLPGATTGGFVVVIRLARLARIVMASHGARRLVDRLGRVALVAASVVIVASLVAFHAEHHTNSEFATIGDALWWGIVTLTTVGYGDIVPKTPTGRWAGVVIMFTGVAVLGVLAGSLSSFFGLGDSSDSPAARQDNTSTLLTEEMGTVAMLTAEIVALRTQVEELASRLAPREVEPDQ